MFRRDFLRASAAGTVLGGVSPDMWAQSNRRAGAHGGAWNNGQLLHLLPTVSDSELLIKASFAGTLNAPPVLRVGSRNVAGRMTDTRGQMWQFHATGLAPARRYPLALLAGGKSGGKALCEPWHITTFPAPDAKPDKVRVLLFTCAGGHEAHTYLPTVLRNRLLRRGLSFQPDAAIANGDHVYWDLRSPLTAKSQGQSPAGLAIAGTPTRSSPIFGSDNEQFIKKAAGPQIVPVYGTDFRSTPVYFIQDDHDYYDNDDAYDEIVTFPPDHFMREMARATQSMYYPEFLPDAARPAGLPGASAYGRARPVAESFGTLRFGRLLEMLLYSVRSTMTMAGPSAVFLEDTVEGWLKARMAATDVAHVVNLPSNPPGWTAGKWGEWYADMLSPDGKLTDATPKPYWQSGWLKQHDRLMTAMSAMRGRVPLVMSGDLHASAIGRMLRTGNTDLSANPVVAVLTGTVGTRPTGWPSGIRKIAAQPPQHIRMEEWVKPTEEHGFTLADFTPDKVTLRMFKWNNRTQPPEALDTLEPFHTVELPRPA